MDEFAYGLLAAIGLLAAAGLAWWCNKRYEIAIFLVAVSPWFSAFFFPATEVDVDGAPEAALGSYVRIGLVMLIGAIGLFRFIQTWARDREALPPEFLLLGGFLLFALLSTGYSIDQQYTFVRAASFVGLFGFLLGLYSWIDSEQRLNQALYALLVMVFLVTLTDVVTLVAIPERAWVADRFQGLWSSPNGMGSSCMLAYPFLVWAYPRCNTLKKWMVALAIV